MSVLIDGATMPRREELPPTLAVVGLATIGTTAPFIRYAIRNVEMPSNSIAINYAASMSVAVGMLALVALVGFREK